MKQRVRTFALSALALIACAAVTVSLPAQTNSSNAVSNASPAPVSAQQKPAIAGDYAGTLGPLHLKLHLKIDAAGAVAGTLDSTDQGAIGIPCADFHLEGQALSFTVPAVHGSWKGTVSADGVALSGAWDQGGPQPLNFVRDTFVPADKPSQVDGIWLGALTVGGQSLRAQLHVKSDSMGH